jgi:tRNA pseudouridine55 synthase
MNQDLDIVRIINKPLNWTSFDVCNYLKREYPKKTKIGHAGTLDPLATGVLVIAVGKATKRIDTIQAQVKEYEAEVTFGASTLTYDAEVYPEEIKETNELTESIINESLKNFVGEIDQTPPAFSALKINGKRAYELARAGEVVVMKSRKATVYNIELLNFEQINGITKISLRINCAKGTYIRSIANDLGVALGCGAFLSKLVRTKVGEYNIENSEPFAKEIN